MKPSNPDAGLPTADDVRGIIPRSTPAQDATALLPCPLCGETRIFLNAPNPHHHYGSINCPACMVVLPGAVRDQGELIRCWNDRSTPSASAGPQAEAVAWVVSGGDGYERRLFETLSEAKAFDRELYENGWDDVKWVALYAHPQPQQADGRGAVIEALKAAKDHFDNEFSESCDLPHKHRISVLCDKVDAALAALCVSRPDGKDAAQ